MMAKDVVVTVRYKGFAQDMELPVRLGIGQLCGKILETLKQVDNHTFCSFERILLLHDGFCLADEAATLEDYGIQTGYFLDIHQEA